MMVELLRTRSADGISLEGILRTPIPGREPNLPLDVVVMHHGVGGSFYRESFQDVMADAFLARGVAVMRVNNRGHDLAYNALPEPRRMGAAFETVADCRHDWTAWIDVAEARGYRRIGLWGQSLGAVKTICFLAEGGDSRIARAIATSPPRFSYSAYLARPDGSLFEASVRRARERAEADGPDALLSIDIPTSAVMTARTFLDKYGPDERYDIVRHLPRVKTPLLVTVGGLEGTNPDQPDRFGFGGLAPVLAGLAERDGTFAFRLVDGADHHYTGVTDALWSEVEAWLSGG